MLSTTGASTPNSLTRPEALCLNSTGCYTHRDAHYRLELHACHTILQFYEEVYVYDDNSSYCCVRYSIKLLLAILIACNTYHR